MLGSFVALISDPFAEIVRHEGGSGDPSVIGLSI
jgi:hypothetical protein